MQRELAKAGFAFFVDLGTFNLERFGCVFGGDLRAAVDPLHAIACGPANSIAQNQPDILIVIDRIGLVAGAEVKDFAVATLPSATGAENFTPFKPGDENNLVSRGNRERVAVHFDVHDFEIASNTAPDRLCR